MTGSRDTPMAPRPAGGASSRIGIDLGGTKTEAIVLADDGSVLVRRRVATPHGYEPCLDSIVALVAAVEKETHTRGTVGIGIPGMIAPGTGRVRNANSTWLNGHPLASDLEIRLGRPLRVMNDANCFALSESVDGAGAGAHVVFGVILGTGVGGGVVVGGELLAGASLIGGEWGHNPLPWPTANELPGAACYCGKRGCIECYLSGPGMERDHVGSTGTARTTRQIVEAAGAGDLAAAATLARYHHRLGRGLASVANLLDPDLIVLGGGMSNLPNLAEHALRSMRDWVFTDQLRTRIAIARHGDSSGVRGAAWLWPPLSLSAP